MKTLHRFLFVISFTLVTCFSLNAQNEQGIAQESATDSTTVDTLDTATKTNSYGLRIGLELSKPLRSFLDDTYQGLAIVGDFRIKDRYYLAAELGTETKEFDEPTYDAQVEGSYLKAGINYNAYNNWEGMSNLIYVGFHLGFSTFNQDLNNYTIYTTNSFYEPDVRTNPRNYSNLNLIWAELQMGLQVELFNNLYMGLNVQLKRILSQKAPDDFTNLYAPGYNKVTFDNVYGAGYGYTISYLIPIFKK